MSDKTNQSKEHDSFDELFRRKLANHRLPVDGADWEIIEERLSGKKKARIVLLRSASVAAAAAAVLLLIIGRPFGDRPEIVSDSGYIASNDVSARDRERVSTDTVPENTADKTNPAPQNAASTGLSAHRKTDVAAVSRREMTYPDGIAEVTADETASPLSESVAMDTTADTLPANEEPAARLSESVADASVSSDEVPKLDISLVEDKPDEVPEDKKSGKRILAAAIGTGGGGSNFLDMPMAEKDMQMSSYSNGAAAEASSRIQSFEDMDIDRFSNIDYAVPLSFGATVSKNVGEHLSVGVGLMYTYLSTTYEWTQWTRYDVHQQLHYLGLPVQLTVYPGSGKSKLKTYFSGGLMVEKGLRLVYKQQENQGNYVYTTTVKTSVGGVQWSINGAFGIVYQFEKGFGVYFEPRMSYYFDNDQPASIRSDKRFSFGVGMGVNYEF